jgi:hypothetical protein
VLRKKELKQEFWPRLLKDNKKMHFLKTNFDKVRSYSVEPFVHRHQASNQTPN